MGARPYPLPPLVTLSTGASRLRPSTLFRAASDAGVDGVDLDLSGRPWPDPRRVAAAAERHNVAVRSIWVPRPGIWTGWRSDRAMEVTAALVGATGAGFLVIDGPVGNDGSLSRSAMTRLTEAAHGVAPPGTHVVIALRGRHLEGGRRHLVQMTSLRRLAEEWEFGVALDLSGTLDARWEAEAAVSRLGARLTMIRLPANAASGPSSGGNRVAVRALAAAMDSGYPTQFAVVPGVPFWQSGYVPALARACATAKRRIAERHSVVEEQRVFDAFPHPWQEHRG